VRWLVVGGGWRSVVEGGRPGVDPFSVFYFRLSFLFFIFYFFGSVPGRNKEWIGPEVDWASNPSEKEFGSPEFDCQVSKFG
jgi:hypothetical protein